MAVLRILQYPDSALLKKASTVTKIAQAMKHLVRDMTDTMYQSRGVGLAAPQVGISKQIIVISPQGRPGEERVLINPKIVERSKEEELGTEGCLSLSDFSADVPRAKKIVLRAIDLNDSPVEETIEGFPARVIQHEVDHLNGILIVDYVKPARQCRHDSTND